MAANYSGAGIGKALLDNVVEQAKRANLIRLYLETWDSMHAAIHLYESHGWKRARNPPKESGANRAYTLDLEI